MSLRFKKKQALSVSKLSHILALRGLLLCVIFYGCSTHQVVSYTQLDTIEAGASRLRIDMTNEVSIVYGRKGFVQKEGHAIDHVIGFMKVHKGYTLEIICFYSGGGKVWERKNLALSGQIFEYIVSNGVPEERVDFFHKLDKHQKYPVGGDTQQIHFILQRNKKL